MTPYNYYRVTLSEFLRKVQDNIKRYEGKGYTPAMAAMFAELVTCIYYLDRRFKYLKTQRLDLKTNILIEEYVAVSEKLERKIKKYKRYQKWRRKYIKQS